VQYDIVALQVLLNTIQAIFPLCRDYYVR